MSDRLQIFRDAISYSTSAVVAQCLGLASGVIVARVLGPTDFGVWNAVSLALTYGAYVDPGILSAMGRDLPYYLGQGDLRRAKEIEGTAFVTTLGGATLVALALVVFSFWSGLSSYMAFGLRGMAMLVVLQRMYVFYQMVLRAHNEFGLLSRVQMIFALVSTGVTIVLVVWLSFIGRVVAAVLSQLIGLTYVVSLRKWNITLGLNPQVALRLARIGIPIITSLVVMGMLTTIDRVMVLSFLGETELGYFGLALLMGAVVSTIPTMAGQVLCPRITFRYGQSGDDIRAVERYVLTPPVLLSCVLPLLIGPLYLVLPVLVHTILPAYAPGIAAARMVLLGIFFSGIVGIADYFFITIGKLKQYVLIACGALALNVGVDVLSLKMGLGIEGIAVAGTLITYSFYSAIVIGYALGHYTRKVKDWLRFFVKLFSPFAYMLLLLVGIEWLIRVPARAPLVDAFPWMGIQVLLFGLGCVPLGYCAVRELKAKPLQFAR